LRLRGNCLRSTKSPPWNLRRRPPTGLASIGVSVDFFSEHVQSSLRIIRQGRLVLIPVRELERWVERNAARTIEP
jgi:hypothetical protein